MNLIFLLPVLIVVMVMVTEIASRIAYGRMLKEKEIEEFLEKNLKKYIVNTSAYPRKLLFNINLPSIGRIPFPPRWYISNYGIILRHSKCSKTLDNYWDSLDKPKKKELN